MPGFFDKLGRGLGKGVSAATGKLLVIQHDFAPGELVWEYPRRMIPYGSRIVVGPNQAAIIIRSGKILGVLRQGEWVLDTAHLPGLRGIMEGLYEGVPLPIRIIFVNIVEKDLRFGGRANTVEGVDVVYHGRVRIAIPEDDEGIKKFVLKVAAEDKSLTTEELEESIRDYINDRVESYIGSFYAIEVHSRKGAVRSLIEAELAKLLESVFYIRVKAIAIDIDIPEEWLKKLQETGYMQMMALAVRAGLPPDQVYRSLQNYDLMRRFMDALKSSQGGQVASIFAFFPLLQSLTQQMGQQLQPLQQPQQVQQRPQQPASQAGVAAVQPQQPPPQSQQQAGPSVPRQPGYTPRCPYCGADLSQFAAMRPKYCPMCGKPLKWCPNGHVAPAEARFCPVCGAKLE